MENANKIKLLKLFEFLQHESDETHPITAVNICKKLNECGILCDRRTLTKDIKTLNDFGYEVLSKMVGHEKAYYVEDRSFNVPEIKILIDAVQSATFITNKKTSDLIDKIAILGGNPCAEILKESGIHYNIRKHSNEQVYYNIDLLEKAIQTHKKVSFQYFDIDENGEIEYRKSGEFYICEPLSMKLTDDNYYLISYDTPERKLKTYRIDKMKRVGILDDNISHYVLSMLSNAESYATEAFRMYEGEPKNITLSFDKLRMGAIYDKFGENTKIKKVDENKYIATVKIQESPPFWGWLFQFEGNITIVYPDDMIKICNSKIKDLFEKMSLNQENKND